MFVIKDQQLRLLVLAHLIREIKASETNLPGGLTPQQITELQAAVSQQSAHVTELAAQLESTVLALEQAAQVAEARLRRVLVCTALAVAFAVAALGVAFVAVLAR